MMEITRPLLIKILLLWLSLCLAVIVGLLACAAFIARVVAAAFAKVKGKGLAASLVRIKVQRVEIGNIARKAAKHQNIRIFAPEARALIAAWHKLQKPAAEPAAEKE